MDGDRLTAPVDAGVSRRDLFSGAPAAAAGLGATFALAVQPVQAQTMIVTPTDGLTAGEVKVTCSDGKEMAGWMRMTSCFRKQRGKWRIVHEHFSAPFDPQSDKTLWLEP